MSSYCPDDSRRGVGVSGAQCPQCCCGPTPLCFGGAPGGEFPHFSHRTPRCAQQNEFFGVFVNKMTAIIDSCWRCLFSSFYHSANRPLTAFGFISPPPPTPQEDSHPMHTWPPHNSALHQERFPCSIAAFGALQQQSQCSLRVMCSQCCFQPRALKLNLTDPLLSFPPVCMLAAARGEPRRLSSAELVVSAGVTSPAR